MENSGKRSQITNGFYPATAMVFFTVQFTQIRRNDADAHCDPANCSIPHSEQIRPSMPKTALLMERVMLGRERERERDLSVFAEERGERKRTEEEG
jgi:hypothetical protein